MPPLEAVLVGAGQRGTDAIGAYAKRCPDELKFIAVADVNEGKRQRFARQHDIPDENCFSRYEDLFSRPPLAPLCFNATMDKVHLPSAKMALECGYDLFLEKPMADTAEGCMAISKISAQKKRITQICHPLRYTTFYMKVKELLESGAIGKVLNISMAENVGYWHFAHSFVRGNWGVVESCGPLILTKCCHDMDMATWLADSQAEAVQSVGRTLFFNAGNAPAGAPARCTDGCPAEKTCPFYAPAAYLGEQTEWPVSAISLDSSLEARRHALETGPYGRCVFRCDNTAVDHQEVTGRFENGVQLNFSVHANTAGCYRTLRILGSEGELKGSHDANEISVTRFKPGIWVKCETETFKTDAVEGGHGGGDTGAIATFLRCVRERDMKSARRSLDIAMEGHLLAFAAEQARAEGKTVQMPRFRRSVARNIKKQQPAGETA